MSNKDVLSMYSKTILLVDDVPLFIEMARDLFRREQVQILTAGNGPEAVGVVKKTRPDIVFMDLYMSGGDGDVACREIKGHDSCYTTPVIMVTSSTLPHDIERCRAAGCDDYLIKPLTREGMLDKCNRFVKAPDWAGKRLAARLPARFGAGPEMPFAGVITDVGVGGVFLETDKLQAVNSTLWLEFRLGEQLQTINCKGRVAWLNTALNQKKNATVTGMGIEFAEMRKLDILAVQDWIVRKLRHPAVEHLLPKSHPWP